jgi:hypothetical protein
MTRAPEVGVAVLAAATMATWVAALLHSMPPPAPTLVVQGEPLVPAGGPLALRVTAARERATARSRVSGSLASGRERAPIVDGAGRIDRLAGPVEIDVRVDDELRVRARLTVAEARLRLGPPKLLFFPWRSEVQTVVAAVEGGPRWPLYPLEGRVSARLPSRVLVLEGPADAAALDGDDGRGGPRILEVAPRIQGALLPDGRVLAVDRSGLRASVPLEVDAPGEIEVAIESAEPREVSLDLVVDGAVQDVVSMRVERQATARLRLGPGRPGDVVVVHAGGPWPDELGRFAIARVRDPATPLARWVADLATRAGAPLDEPLLQRIRQEEGGDAPDPDLLRALLGRLKPVKLRAPRLELALDVETPLGQTLRLAYAVAAAALVLAVGLLGALRLPGRRGAAVLGTIAVGAVLGGLFLALLVVSAGTAA